MLRIAGYIPPEDALDSVDQVFDELDGIREILPAEASEVAFEKKTKVESSDE